RSSPPRPRAPTRRYLRPHRVPVGIVDVTRRAADQRTQHGRLPCSVPPDQRHLLAAREARGESIDHLQVSVALGQPLDLQRVRPRRPSPYRSGCPAFDFWFPPAPKSGPPRLPSSVTSPGPPASPPKSAR